MAEIGIDNGEHSESKAERIHAYLQSIEQPEDLSTKPDTPKTLVYSGTLQLADKIHRIPGKSKAFARNILDPEGRVFYYILFFTSIAILIAAICFFGNILHLTMQHDDKIENLEKMVSSSSVKFYI